MPPSSVLSTVLHPATDNRARNLRSDQARTLRRGKTQKRIDDDLERAKANNNNNSNTDEKEKRKYNYRRNITGKKIRKACKNNKPQQHKFKSLSPCVCACADRQSQST